MGVFCYTGRFWQIAYLEAQRQTLFNDKSRTHEPPVQPYTDHASHVACFDHLWGRMGHDRPGEFVKTRRVITLKR